MDEWAQGYFDGRDRSAPEPGSNRDPRYVHSFRVGRAELAGDPIPAEVSRRRAAEIEAMLSD
jgi:hypothetical protein